jgi:hypothetical protein
MFDDGKVTHVPVIHCWCEIIGKERNESISRYPMCLNQIAEDTGHNYRLLVAIEDWIMKQTIFIFLFIAFFTIY